MTSAPRLLAAALMLSTTAVVAGPAQQADSRGEQRARRWFAERFVDRVAAEMFQEYKTAVDAGRDAKWLIGERLTLKGHACVVTALKGRLEDRRLTADEAARAGIEPDSKQFYEVIRDSR